MANKRRRGIKGAGGLRAQQGPDRRPWGQSPASATEPPSEPLKPAVPIRKSITADFLICLEDGKKLKMLKRHLRSTYNMTPDEYRSKWSLPADYPMVAPNYAEQRSEFAKRIGLGRGAGRPPGRRAMGTAASVKK